MIRRAEYTGVYREVRSTIHINCTVVSNRREIESDLIIVKK